MIRSNLEKNISIAINAYDAEKHLPQVEDSVKHFDEIIVCDMEVSTMSYTVQLWPWQDWQFVPTNQPKFANRPGDAVEMAILTWKVFCTFTTTNQKQHGIDIIEFH